MITQSYYQDPTANTAIARVSSWQNKRNKDLGQWAERCFLLGCERYSNAGRAEIHKTPEPFRVFSTAKQNRTAGKGGKFDCIPQEKAQPDFQGTLQGGYSFVCEMKSTASNRIESRALTKTQAEQLNRHSDMGAVAYVCCYINSSFFMVPWEIWKHMKEEFGRKYVTAQDLRKFRVKFDGSLLFLDWMDGGIVG